MPSRKREAVRSRTKKSGAAGPRRIAIVAMGASNASYITMAASNGHRAEIADEVWAINAMAGLIYHDRAFVMDDVKYVLADQTKNGRKVAAGVFKWLPAHDKPVYTTTAYPEWPALVEYPVADVLQSIGGVPYLNNTVAYAVAYAIYLGVKEISLFGCDFSYPDAHISESGRGCVEFLLGTAAARGISINLPDTTTLLDAHVPMNRKLYGYHQPVTPEVVDGKIVLKRGE